MSVSTTNSRDQYLGNASTVTPYPITFDYDDEADLVVVVTDEDGVEETLELTTDYVVGVSGVVTNVAIPATSRVTIFRLVETLQPVSYVENDEFRASTHEAALDRLTYIAQQLERATLRAFRVSESSDYPDELPAVGMINRFLGYDAAGDFGAMSPAEVLAVLELSGTLFDKPTASWADDAARALKVPDFTGQVGIQLDTGAAYRSTGTSAGNWSALVPSALSITAAMLAANAVETAKIADGNVTLAKLANIATQSLIGRGTAAAGVPESITLSAMLEITGGALGLKDGTITAAKLAAGVGAQQVAILQHQAASGTAGGTFTSGAWRTRPITTEVSDPSNIVSIASNQFTLGAGTYLIRGRATAGRVSTSQARVQNITDGTTAGLGNLVRCASSTVEAGVDAHVSALVTIAGSKVFELQHRCETTVATDGMGIASSWGTEVYATIEILKIA